MPSLSDVLRLQQRAASAEEYAMLREQAEVANATRNPFTSTVKGTLLGSMGGGAMTSLGNLTGSLGADELSKGFYQIGDGLRKKAAPMMAPQLDYTTVKDLSSLIDFGAANMGQGVGSMLPIALGARFGGPALGLSAAFLPQHGENVLRIKDDPTLAGMSERDILSAAAPTAAAQSALEYIVPGGVAGRMLGKGTDALKLGRGGRAAGMLGGTMLAEGGTELGQEELGMGMHTLLNPERDTSGDNHARMQSFLGGMVGGAPVGAMDAGRELLKGYDTTFEQTPDTGPARTMPLPPAAEIRSAPIGAENGADTSVPDTGPARTMPLPPQDEISVVPYNPIPEAEVILQQDKSVPAGITDDELMARIEQADITANTQATALAQNLLGQGSARQKKLAEQYLAGDRMGQAGEHFAQEIVHAAKTDEYANKAHDLGKMAREEISAFMSQFGAKKKGNAETPAEPVNPQQTETHWEDPARGEYAPLGEIDTQAPPAPIDTSHAKIQQELGQRFAIYQADETLSPIEKAELKLNLINLYKKNGLLTKANEASLDNLAMAYRTQDVRARKNAEADALLADPEMEQSLWQWMALDFGIGLTGQPFIPKVLRESGVDIGLLVKKMHSNLNATAAPITTPKAIHQLMAALDAGTGPSTKQVADNGQYVAPVTRGDDDLENLEDEVERNKDIGTDDFTPNTISGTTVYSGKSNLADVMFTPNDGKAIEKKLGQLRASGVEPEVVGVWDKLRDEHASDPVALYKQEDALLNKYAKDPFTELNSRQTDDVESYGVQREALLTQLNMKYQYIKHEQNEPAEASEVNGSDFRTVSAGKAKNKWAVRTETMEGDYVGKPSDGAVWFQKDDGTPFATTTGRLIALGRKMQTTGSKVGAAEQRDALALGISSFLSAKETDGRPALRPVYGFSAEKGKFEWTDEQPKLDNFPKTLKLYDGTINNVRDKGEGEKPPSATHQLEVLDYDRGFIEADLDAAQTVLAAATSPKDKWVAEQRVKRLQVKHNRNTMQKHVWQRELVHNTKLLNYARDKVERAKKLGHVTDESWSVEEAIKLLENASQIGKTEASETTTTEMRDTLRSQLIVKVNDLDDMLQSVGRDEETEQEIQPELPLTSLEQDFADPNQPTRRNIYRKTNREENQPRDRIDTRTENGIDRGVPLYSQREGTVRFEGDNSVLSYAPSGALVVGKVTPQRTSEAKQEALKEIERHLSKPSENSEAFLAEIFPKQRPVLRDGKLSETDPVVMEGVERMTQPVKFIAKSSVQRLQDLLVKYQDERGVAEPWERTSPDQSMETSNFYKAIVAELKQRKVEPKQFVPASVKTEQVKTDTNLPKLVTALRQKGVLYVADYGRSLKDNPVGREKLVNRLYTLAAGDSMTPAFEGLSVIERNAVQKRAKAVLDTLVASQRPMRTSIPTSGKRAEAKNVPLAPVVKNNLPSSQSSMEALTPEVRTVLEQRGFANPKPLVAGNYVKLRDKVGKTQPVDGVFVYDGGEPFTSVDTGEQVFVGLRRDSVTPENYVKAAGVKTNPAVEAKTEISQDDAEQLEWEAGAKDRAKEKLPQFMKMVNKIIETSNAKLENRGRVLPEQLDAAEKVINSVGTKEDLRLFQVAKESVKQTWAETAKLAEVKRKNDFLKTHPWAKVSEVIKKAVVKMDDNTLFQFAKNKSDQSNSLSDGPLRNLKNMDFAAAAHELTKRRRDDLTAKLFNQETPDLSAMPDGPEQAAIRARIEKQLGPMIVEFSPELFGTLNGEKVSFSADWSPGVIRIALGALNPMQKGMHEAMHELFNRITAVNGTHNQARSAKKMRETLLRAANSLPVYNQLRRLLKDHPNALKQIEEGSPDYEQERLAYMYQFWQAGALNIGPENLNIFQRIVKFLRKVTRLLSNEQQAEQILQAFDDGKFADKNQTSVVVEALMNDVRAGDNFIENAKALAEGPLGKLKNFVYTAHGVLHDSKIKPLVDLANLFDTLQGESGKQGFFQARRQKASQYINRMKNVLGDISKFDLEETLKALQREDGVIPTDARQAELYTALRALLNDLHIYLDDANVMRLKERLGPGEPEWEKIPRRKNYFPVVWEVIGREAEFVADLLKYNTPELESIIEREGFDITPDVYAQMLAGAVTSRSGVKDLNESTSSLGFSPLMTAVNARKLDWLAPEMAKYRSQDLVATMTSYISQATKRAEYVRRFDNGGTVIKDAMLKALEVVKDRMKTEDKYSGENAELIDEAAVKEVMKYQNAVMALEGTIGYDINPNLRELSSVMMVYQNYRTLIPTLFSSMSDPLGIMVRGGELNDAWQTMRRGFSEVWKRWKSDSIQNDDDATRLAEMIGSVDAGSFLEALGQTYSSLFMSGKVKRANDALFKWNGMEAWNRGMRVGATQAAIKFIKKHIEAPDKDSARYLKELFDNNAVPELIDGELDYTNPMVQQAIVRWVDGAILSPNAAQRPAWASDPHYALFFHMKQFTYSFHKIILKRAFDEARIHGNARPALTLIAGYIPLVIVADAVKYALFTGGEEPYWMQRGLGETIQHGASRANLMGVPQLGLDAFGRMGMQEGPIDGVLEGAMSLAGPTTGWAKDWYDKPISDQLILSLPGGPSISQMLRDSAEKQP